MDKIIRYLIEHDYDKQIFEKDLHSPTQKTFVSIISFLFKSAIPNFQFTDPNKLADEVQQLLKCLGYPCTIQKSHLTTIGAPNSWPNVLAALAWLVDLINYNERAKEIEDTSFDEDLDGGTKMFLDYLEKGYKLFLSGEDDLSPLEEEVALTFESKNAGLNADIEKLTKANELLSVQVKEFVDDNGKTPLQAEQESARLLEEDKNKYSKHMKTLQEHKAKLCDQLQLRTGESTTCRNDLAALRAEIEQHKATVAAQDLTPADVRRMHDERTHLEKEVESLQAQKDALSKQLWDEQTAQQRTIDRLEGKVQKANSCLLRLHMIKASAKNANGVSHELALNKHLLDTAPEQLLSVDTKEVLLPGLQRVKKGVNDEVLVAQDELLENERNARRREEDAAERAEQLSALMADLAKLEKEEKRMREEHAKELSDMKAETEALEEQIVRRRADTGQTVAASQSELKALQKELDEFNETAKRTREKIYSQLNSSLDMLLMHKDEVEKSLTSLKEHCAAKMDVLDSHLEQVDVQ